MFGGKKYGPSRTRWLLIGLVIGLILGILLGNPDTGVMSVMSPSELMSALMSVTM